MQDKNDKLYAILSENEQIHPILPYHAHPVLFCFPI